MRLVSGHEDIFAFDVTMVDLLVVHMFQSEKQLSDVVQYSILCQRILGCFTLLDKRMKITSRQIFKNDVDYVLFFLTKETKVFDQLWVI